MPRRPISFVSQLEEFANSHPTGEVVIIRDFLNGVIARRQPAGVNVPRTRVAKTAKAKPNGAGALVSDGGTFVANPAIHGA